MAQVEKCEGGMRQLLGHFEIVFDMRMLTGCFPGQLQTRFSHTFPDLLFAVSFRCLIRLEVISRYLSPNGWAR